MRKLLDSYKSVDIVAPRDKKRVLVFQLYVCSSKYIVIGNTPKVILLSDKIYCIKVVSTHIFLINVVELRI